MKGWASTRWQLAATLIFAVLVTGGFAAATRFTRAADACEQVLIASSQEKASMLQGFAVSYDAGRPQVGGRCVTVSVEKVDSGDAELALANGWTGSTRPEVWSPASSAWVNLLTADAPAVAARLLPVSPDFLFQSPLVIGMPQPMALALGYRTKAIGWALILHLAQDPRGWGAYGHPDWGKFKLGKTNPTISTSGLHALIGAYYAAPGGSDLSVPTVESAPVKAFVGAIEASVVHYGKTATDFLQHLRYMDYQGEEATLRYISAIALEEQELADYNAGLVAGVQHSPPHVKLVAIYPSGGTPVADHPYVVLGWSTDGQKAAALAFEDFIKRQWRTIEARHFRFGDNPTPALASEVYPDAQIPALVRLVSPAGPVLKAMLDGWKSVRKAARVLILIDTAVPAGTLTSAIGDLAGAASGFEPQDRVGIWTFPAPGGQPASHTVLRDVTGDDASLSGTLAGVKPVKGPSDLEGALYDAVTEMAATYDPSAINAVVVLELSPGKAAGVDMAFLTEKAPLVRVFTVGPASKLLTDIAVVGDGTFYEPGAASHFLNDAISNF